MTDGEKASRKPMPAVVPRPKHLPLAPQTGSAAIPLVPARMVNEVLYCERLMYLEWRQGEFADNAFTLEGRATHSRTDEPGGNLPPPPRRADDVQPAEDPSDGEDPKPYQARSIWLTSERLGLTGKVDIVEADETGRVTPIEYKRGQAPALPAGAYPPELAQVCAQVLLLRDHGYVCDAGELYFAKSKRRVRVAVTDALVATTLAAISRARELALRTEAPPPLRDSPKCRGCSLVEICLPDEVDLLRRLEALPSLPDPFDPELAPDLAGPLEPDPWGLAGDLATAPGAPVRRLYAARDDRVPLYVQDPRVQIALTGERLVVRHSDGATHVRLSNTSQVVIRGNAQISTQAIRALLERGIPLSFLSGGGWFLGRVTGTDTKNVDLRLAQHRATQDQNRCLTLAQGFVAAKIKNCRTLLRRNHTDGIAPVLFELKQLTRKALKATTIESLLGIEGAAGRAYFQAFTGMLKRKTLGTFDFERRNRRPPRDPVNAMLSFVYALLTRDLVVTLSGVGLDPLLGFYHQPRFGRPALALDIMEEFRPLIADSVVITAINNGVVAMDDFVTVADACNLKPPARRKLIDTYERRMDDEVAHPIFGYRISYRRVLEIQARLLSRVLLGELNRYPSFTTR